ncbi:HalOD1 output domain-containing protein [Haloterrigena salifodinae]|uniref:HalOD1 output domain-containing protein n=1 Tax=Haloterrigena salifodinae TaxID=2675099 RepID=UPI000F86176A|nr:HalOD1 output domain-containing protein [Haloterrigena salifodinae]
MSDRPLLVEIVDALETEGLGRDEYQLHRVIDVDALEELVDSANDDLEVRFSVGECRVLVTQSDVRFLTKS